MNRLKIVCVGKLKEDYFSSAEAEYLKRLKRYAKIDIEEVPAISLKDGMSEKECEDVLKKEGQAVLKATKGFDVIVAMAIEGKQPSSEDFAKVLKGHFDFGKSVCFLIGGSLGLSHEVKKEADMLISISKMTLPHRLCRVVLLEQIYRAFKIINNETYHK